MFCCDSCCCCLIFYNTSSNGNNRWYRWSYFFHRIYGYWRYSSYNIGGKSYNCRY